MLRAMTMFINACDVDNIIVCGSFKKVVRDEEEVDARF
jgi:hypothetical protein